MIQALPAEPEQMDAVDCLRRAKRDQQRCVDWFLTQEIRMEERSTLAAEGVDPHTPQARAELLVRTCARLPLSLLPGQAIAGTQDGAFSPSYALINPAFTVESFAGYCDPTAIYNDLEPDAEFTPERIARVRAYWESTPYVRALKREAEQGGAAMAEVVFFAEPVTGHLVPDLRPLLRRGVVALQEEARGLGTPYGQAMARALDAVLVLARRYAALARDEAASAGSAGAARRLVEMSKVLRRVPAGPAATLHEAVQAFALLWQTMVLEQAPNPYALSVGNLDRILAPYYDAERDARAQAVSLVRHLLCFFQVGRQCWAISQNVMVGGCGVDGDDLTTPMTAVVLDAFRASNDPQPALSVKLHDGTPDALYERLAAFFFSPGHSTPSLFSDPAVFALLERQGVAKADLPDYGIAGCQEPLVMGKSAGNTTNTWLNLAKLLELACNDGCSLLSGERLGPSWRELGYADANAAYVDLETVFYRQLDWFLPRMAAVGNGCTHALGRHRPVPFTSVLMGGMESGRDQREPGTPGVRYGASGCLIHGLSVVADSLEAVAQVLQNGIACGAELQAALQADFVGYDDLAAVLGAQGCYGNGESAVDGRARDLVRRVGDAVGALRNPAGHPFVADWSTPSTHLLYGHWVGATPDGRRARTMLGYGVDPLPGRATRGLAARILSTRRLPFSAMTGGYASHIGLDPQQAPKAQPAAWLRRRIVEPLFAPVAEGLAPYYVYLNVDDVGHLRRVLAEPERYAPSGVYIMRIHGTFVNFLDLSPAIQEDIMARLDPGSTSVLES